MKRFRMIIHEICPGDATLAHMKAEMGNVNARRYRIARKPLETFFLRDYFHELVELKLGHNIEF